MTYASVVPELDNLPTVASGLVAVPETGLSTMPMVSYQHGTVFDRNYVPSRPDQSMETRIMIARFAAQGYVVIGADYFGRGDSDLPDAYLVKAQRAAGQLRHADRGQVGARRARRHARPQLFLSGWSQGGWTTMVYLERLEGLGVPVTAAAVASGPVDIALIREPLAQQPAAGRRALPARAVTLLLLADAFYHQVPGLDALAIEPAYLEAARDLYAGRIDFDTLLCEDHAVAPGRSRRRSSARRSQASKGAFWQRLDERQGYRWKLVTPRPHLVWRRRRGDADLSSASCRSRPRRCSAAPTPRRSTPARRPTIAASS